MSTDLKNSILKKLYDKYFENSVLGFWRNALVDEFSSGNPDKLLIILNELEDDSLITLEGNSYQITVSGIEYLEEEKLVDNSKVQQRNEIIKILKEPYEKDVDKNVTHEIFVEKLNLSGPIEISSQMIYLVDVEYLYLEMALGGNFWTRLTNAGYQFSKNL